MHHSVFIDDSAWIALFYPRDNNHEAARRAYGELLAQPVLLVTTSWVAYEAMTFLKDHRGWEAAECFWSALHKSRGSLALVRVDEEVEQEALKLFLSSHDRAWGILDCTSLVVLKALGCEAALAFDRQFRVAGSQHGFALLPEE